MPQSLTFFAIILVASWLAYKLLAKRAIALSAANHAPLQALPSFYGWCGVIWVGLPLLLISVFAAGQLTLLEMAALATLLVSASHLAIKPNFKARQHVEGAGKLLLIGAASLSIAITAMIVLSVLFEAIAFFQKVSVWEFIFGTVWSPQTALRADQAGSSGSFGAIPVFVGTMLVTVIAMLVATPLGIYAAVYLSEYASPKTRDRIKPLLEILAGIPTVVYGYFAVVTIAPSIRDFGAVIGLDIASESALAAGLVMGIMIIPFILSLSDDVLHAVPNSLREASIGLGATQAETIQKVLLPAALPGIMGAVLLGISRAIGETMIVVMAAGLAAQLTFNPLDSVTTVTVQIVTLLTGDQEFDSAKTLAAFALGLTLFVITLILNIIALRIVKKYREQYE